MKKSFLLVFIWGVAGLFSLIAQPKIERISVTERGDGIGYVIRYHLTDMVDNYDLIQPDNNRIQMQLLSTGIDIEDIRMPEVNDEITSIGLVTIEGGVGVEITTADGVYLRAAAYPDQNRRDLLLSLERVTQAESNAVVSGVEPYEWSVSDPESEPEPEETEEETVAETQMETEQAEPGIPGKRTQVSFGISGGVGMANKLAGGYTSDSRQKLVMGLTATADLPFVLFSLNTAAEIGIYYTQKGFRNPSGTIDAQTVVLDYIEIPVLAKLAYDYNNIVKPNLAGGFYTAFRTAAEAIEDNGNRKNLDEVTNKIEGGLIAGFGSDFKFEKTTVMVQIRYSVGLPPMFNEDFSGGERNSALSLLLGLRF